MNDVDEPFAVRAFRYRESVLLALSGELDIAIVPSVELAVAEVVDRGVGVLTVDVAALSFLDVCGQRALLDVAAAVARAGGRFELRGVNEAVRRAIRLVGFDDLERACRLAPD